MIAKVNSMWWLSSDSYLQMNFIYTREKIQDGKIPKVRDSYDHCIAHPRSTKPSSTEDYSLTNLSPITSFPLQVILIDNQNRGSFTFKTISFLCIQVYSFFWCWYVPHSQFPPQSPIISTIRKKSNTLILTTITQKIDG